MRPTNIQLVNANIHATCFARRFALRSVKRLNFYYQNLKSTPQTLSFVNACNDVSLEFLGARAGKGRRWKIDGEWAVDERKVKGRGTQAFNIFWAQT